MTRELPQHLFDFLRSRVVSVERLEALLLLQRTPDRWWSAQAVADELGVSPASMAAALDALCAQNLLDVRVAQSLLFRYRPAGTEDEGSVRELVEAYRTRRLLVLKVVMPANESIRQFADAFRIGGKKERDDG
jgi:hypothetical protein